jgi:vacuolar protein sorting-associated protein 54
MNIFLPANIAISTVLNNPRNPSAPLKSSRAPAPPFTSPDLPRVRRKDFDSYLRAIGPEWEKFERNSRLGTEGIAKLAGAGGSDDGDINTPRPYPTKKNKDVPQLSTVPPVFFDPSFNLGNPRTFASVTEQDLVSNENQLHPEDISLNQILQEKLSHYMDVVEQHLTLEISARAGSFFAALSNLQELQEEGAECLARIEQLRRELKEVDNRQAKRGLDVVRLMKKRENLEVVTEGVKTVKEVGEMLTICERLVEDGSWDRALLLIGEIEALFSIEQKDKSVEAKKQNGIIISNSGISSSLSPKRPLSPLPQLEPPPALRLPSSGSGRTFSSSPHLSPVPESHNTPPLSPLSPTSPHAFAPAPRVPLRSLTSLASLPSHLQALTQEISISLGADVISLLKADLSRRTETAEVEARGDDLRERLTPLLRGLLKTEGMERTLNLYKEATLAEVRSAVKRVSFPATYNEGLTAYDDCSICHRLPTEMLRRLYLSSRRRSLTPKKQFPRKGLSP